MSPGNKHHFQRGYRFPNTRLTYHSDYPSTTRRKVLVRCDCGKGKIAALADILQGDTLMSIVY